MKNKNGFTLIEVLIAASITVIILVGVYGAFSSGIFGYRNIESNLATTQAAIKVFERINLDLRNSFAYSSDRAGFEGNESEMRFFTLTDAFSFVSYSLEDDKLMRLCRKNQKALNIDSEIKPVVLGTNATELVFSYGYLNPETNVLEWKEEWKEMCLLPLAVKVKLVIKHKTTRTFERIIFLPLS